MVLTLLDLDGFFSGTCERHDSCHINEDKKKLTLTVPDAENERSNIALRGIRLDVSGLDADAEVAVTVSSGGAGGINFGTGAGVSATRHIATVKPGITFDVSHASQLYCSTEGAGMPSLKVSEGFASAWE